MREETHQNVMSFICSDRTCLQKQTHSDVDKQWSPRVGSCSQPGDSAHDIKSPNAFQPLLATGRLCSQHQESKRVSAAALNGSGGQLHAEARVQRLSGVKRIL
jgi:hypothetical protein